MWVHMSLTQIYSPHTATLQEMVKPEQQTLGVGLLLKGLGKELWLSPPVKEGI